MHRKASEWLALALFGIVASATTPGAAQRIPVVPVNIESIPAGATVYMDAVSPDKRIGVTPLRNVRVPVGGHILIFQLDNHEEGRLTVDVRRRRETFRMTLSAVATIIVNGVNEPAQGAAVRIDGQPVGNVPFRQNVTPGRHLVQVGREGYVTYSQWADLAGGQAMTIPVTLEREAPRTGSLLVAGDVSGAAVYIDGEPRGVTPNVIENVTEGEHQVEIRADDPAIPPFRQNVRVIAGQRTTLNPVMRPSRPAGGSVRVIVNVRGAIVSLDGTPIGDAPATAENVSPGEHIVEASADGHATAQQTITVEGGQQRVVSIRLEAVAAAPGRIVVNANVDGASVFIDGEDKGSAPVVVEGASGGTHAIVVRARGYQEHRQTCNVGPGRSCEINAELRPVGTQVRVEANVGNAEFYVDGELQGPVPWEGQVPVGSHRIEVRAEGYRTHVEQASLTATSDLRTFSVALTREGAMTDEERAQAAAEHRMSIREATSHTAASLPNNLAVLDISMGWPYVAEARLGVGVFDYLELGFAFRSFGILNDFEARAKFGYRPIRQLSVGGQLRLGGGLGPSRTVTDPRLTPPDDQTDHATNTLFASLELLGTLHFAHAGAFTLWFGLDLHSDKWDFEGRNRNVLNRTPTGGTDMDIDLSRQNLARLRLGGSLEFIINDRWNTFFIFEGIVVGPNRRILGDVFNALDRSDVLIYGRAGFTYKFGM